MAHLSDYRTTDWLNRRPWLALILSLLLHGLLIVILLLQPWAWNRTPPEPQILAEFVQPPPPPAAPAPVPAARRPAEPEVPPLPPASTPQLQRAPVTEESRAQPGPGDRARNQQRSAPQPSPVPAPDRQGPNRAAAPQQSGQEAQPRSERRAGSSQPGQGRAAGPPGPRMTQSESDFFLSQVVAAWAIDFDAPQFRNIQIFGHYKVLPDGTLAPPFGRNDPWDMYAMVNNWDEIENEPRAAAFRTAIETFLRAMRLAQPFEMPPDAEGYPKILSLNFRIGDL